MSAHSSNFNNNLKDLSWDLLTYFAEKVLTPTLTSWSSNTPGFLGTSIHFKQSRSSEYAAIISFGDCDGFSTRFQSSDYGGGDTFVVFYGEISSAKQFLLFDLLKNQLQWLSKRQQQLVVGSIFKDVPVIAYQACEINGRWSVVDANQALADFIGYPIDDFVGDEPSKYLMDFVHPDDFAKLVAAYDYTRTSSQKMTLQYRLLNKEGEYVPVTERVHYQFHEGEVSSNCIVWHRELDQVDSSSQFQVFKDLELFTQDVGLETGREFLKQLCRKLESSKNVDRILLCTKSRDNWWETWVISENGVLKPNFHFELDSGAFEGNAQWNISDSEQEPEFMSQLLFADYKYKTVIPLKNKDEYVNSIFLLGSNDPIVDYEFIAQVIRLFAERTLKEIEQARIADAQIEQNIQLVRQKQQLSYMVTLMGELDNVSTETEFLDATQRILKQAFGLTSITWLNWASGEWRQSVVTKDDVSNWHDESIILENNLWQKSLEHCRKTNSSEIIKQDQTIFWPVGTSNTGFLVVVMKFYSSVPDIELLTFSINALTLALKGLHQREDLRRQAMTDSLTGLGNRSQLHVWIKTALSSSTKASLLLFDLNRFKEINDSFGHQFGDKLLQEIGPRISSKLNDEEYYLSRLGGDEFALLLPNISPQHAFDKAVELHEALAESYFIDQLKFQVEASVGVSHISNICTDGHELLRCADVAMYTAKGSNRNVVIYSTDLDNNTPHKIAVLSELDFALSDGQLWVAYQPLMSTRTGHTVGFEALVRWSHPKFGPLSPAEFIPIAEMGEGIRKITDFVLNVTMSNLVEWQKIMPDMHVAVNISPRVLLNHQFPTIIQNMLDQYNLVGKQIVMELTESTLLVDPVRAIEIINELSEMGIKVEIDDFGTGYSSLAYLKSLPISALKIDRSFVADILTEPQNEVIVSSTVQMAHSLGLQTVAEGVEDEATLLRMMRLGCDLIQGYYYSKPIPEKDVAAWLKRNL